MKSATPKTQSGLSLVELMVALLISTILLLGVLELFSSSSQTQRSANAVARLQENGRLVMNLIAQEARRTGFNGCDGGLDSGNVDFDIVKKETIDFPNESLKDSTDKSVVFRYYGLSNGIKDACERTQLEQQYIEFKNDDDKKNLRVISKETGAGGQILLNHAEIDSIHYLQPCTADPTKTCTYKPDQLPKLPDGTPSFKEVQKLQVTLKLCTDTLSENSDNYCKKDNGTSITRTFSSLIELRNRL